MTQRVEIDGLQVARELYDFVNGEALPGTGVDAQAFWTGLGAIARDLTPKNRALLATRDALQAQIDDWHRANGAPTDLAAYETFLREIGYLLPEGPDFSVTTKDVDDEIARVAGPQLVVPVMNARYALNAANARWGSLYDALYGTDAISDEGGAEKGRGYNPARGDKVIAWAKAFLDDSVPLDRASWTQATGFDVAMGRLAVTLENGEITGPLDGAQLAGYRGE
ncbi:MAG TPA: malate synthase G, partial [Aquamicrobium sp.]|nr:malate synthase G [Aquamicrobium sp.]